MRCCLPLLTAVGVATGGAGCSLLAATADAAEGEGEGGGPRAFQRRRPHDPALVGGSVVTVRIHPAAAVVQAVGLRLSTLTSAWTEFRDDCAQDRSPPFCDGDGDGASAAGPHPSATSNGGQVAWPGAALNGLPGLENTLIDVTIKIAASPRCRCRSCRCSNCAPASTPVRRRSRR